MASLNVSPRAAWLTVAVLALLVPLAQSPSVAAFVVRCAANDPPVRSMHMQIGPIYTLEYPCYSDPCKGLHFEFDLSTGRVGNSPAKLGVPDDDWYMERVENAATPWHPPSYTIQPIWQTSPNTQWINYDPNAVPFGTNSPLPGGGRISTYARSFPAPACAPKSCADMRVDFDFAADNDVQFFLNGASVSGVFEDSFADIPHQHLTVDSCMAAFGFEGLNFLSADVYNEGGMTYTGLMVDGRFIFDS